MSLPQPNQRGVSVFLIYKDSFLLQLRDNKTGIKFPNMWSLVSGGIEADESPEEAIRREVSEEIGIDLKDITFLGSLENRLYRFVSYLNDQDVENIVLSEGQKIEFFSKDAIQKLNLTPKVKQFFLNQKLVNKLLNKEAVTAKEMGLE